MGGLFLAAKGHDPQVCFCLELQLPDRYLLYLIAELIIIFSFSFFFWVVFRLLQEKHDVLL